MPVQNFPFYSAAGFKFPKHEFKLGQNFEGLSSPALNFQMPFSLVLISPSPSSRSRSSSRSPVRWVEASPRDVDDDDDVDDVDEPEKAASNVHSSSSGSLSKIKTLPVIN